jgi:hypothetical protein
MTDASATDFFPPSRGSRGTAAAAVAMVAAPFTKVLLVIWAVVVSECFACSGLVDMINLRFVCAESALVVASGPGRNATAPSEKRIASPIFREPGYRERFENSTHFYRNEFVVLTVPGENPEYAATFNRNFIQLPLDDLFDYEDESLSPFET